MSCTIGLVFLTVAGSCLILRGKSPAPIVLPASTGNPVTESSPVGVPLPKSAFPQDLSAETSRDFVPGEVRDNPAEVDETLLLSSLRELVASGNHQLDPMLAAIADAAQRLTGASGAALATWKDGAMVCRARSGETAPALGAELSVKSGISGECLRKGKLQHCSDTENDVRVDAEVCRSLELRSIAVMPLEGWRGTNGILEVFSTAPRAFNAHHLALLKQLAALAERARASHPLGASPAAGNLPVEKRKRSKLLPASDRVTDVAFAFLDLRSRPLVTGAIVLAAALLVGFVIWLGWRGPRSSGNAQAASTSSPAVVRALAPLSHIPDNDPVWKPNPGGEALFPLAKTSAGTVKLASKVDVLREKKAPRDRSLLIGDAANVALPRRSAGADNSLDVNPTGAERSQESIKVEPPAISAGLSNPAPINGVIVAEPSLPELSRPVSQGVSGGQLVRRVPPVYPAQAKTMHLEGRVVLSAMVTEDGRVRDVRVVEGSPALAQSAMDAVKQWRYKPFLLDGKPAKRETTVTIDFKLPAEGR